MLVRRRVNSAVVGGSERYAPPHLRGGAPGLRGKKRGGGRCRPSSAPVPKSHGGPQRPPASKTRWSVQEAEKGVMHLKIEGKAIPTQSVTLSRKNSCNLKGFGEVLRPTPSATLGPRTKQVPKRPFLVSRNYDWLAEETILRQLNEESCSSSTSKENCGFGCGLLLNNFFFHSVVADKNQHGDEFRSNPTSDSILVGRNGPVSFLSSSEEDPRPTIRLTSRRSSIVQPWVDADPSSQEESHFHTQTDSVSNDEGSESTVVSLGRKIQQMATRNNNKCLVTSEEGSAGEDSNVEEKEWKKILSSNHDLLLGVSSQVEGPFNHFVIPEECEVSQSESICEETTFSSSKKGDFELHGKLFQNDSPKKTYTNCGNANSSVRYFDGNLIEKLNKQRFDKKLNRKPTKCASQELDENASEAGISCSKREKNVKSVTFEAEDSPSNASMNNEKKSSMFSEQEKIVPFEPGQNVSDCIDISHDNLSKEEDNATGESVDKNGAFINGTDDANFEEVCEGSADEVTNVKGELNENATQPLVTLNELVSSEQKNVKSEDTPKPSETLHSSPFLLNLSLFRNKKQQSKNIVEAIDMIQKNQNREENKEKTKITIQNKHEEQWTNANSYRNNIANSKLNQNKEDVITNNLSLLIKKIRVFTQELAENWNYESILESEEVLKDLSESEKFLQEVCAKAGFKNKQEGLQLEELQRVHSKCEEKNAKLRKEMNEKAEQNVEFIRKLLDDKKSLTEKCEELCRRITQTERKHLQKIKLLEERQALEIKSMKEKNAAIDQTRREKWTQHKAKLIKDSAYRNLETKMKDMTRQHQEEISRLKDTNRQALRENEEGWMAKMRDEAEILKTKCEHDKEEACRWERTREAERFQQELQRCDSTWQSRLEATLKQVSQTKTTLEEESQRQIHRLKMDHEDEMRNMRRELEITKEEYEEKIRRITKAHEREITESCQRQERVQAELRERISKESEEGRQKFEKEIRERFRRQRDKEIEKAIAEIQQETASEIEENTKSLNHKIKNLKERYEGEVRDLEECERISRARYVELKGVLAQKEEEIVYLRARLHAQTLEITDFQRMLRSSD